jgi:hypothetical protein
MGCDSKRDQVAIQLNELFVTIRMIHVARCSATFFLVPVLMCTLPNALIANLRLSDLFVSFCPRLVVCELAQLVARLTGKTASKKNSC